MMVYVPMGMEGNAYRPALFESCLKVAPVASFTDVTTAPMTTAPELSYTVPLMREVDVCAMHETAHARIALKKTRRRCVDVRITDVPLLLEIAEQTTRFMRGQLDGES